MTFNCFFFKPSGTLGCYSVRLFVRFLASSAPSAPNLGGSLSAGSHSGGADPDQAWPQSSGEEDLQLQLALAMSKEEAEQVTQISSLREGTTRLPLSEIGLKHTVNAVKKFRQVWNDAEN